MGIYINKGNEGFRQIRNSEYVDMTRSFNKDIMKRRHLYGFLP